MIISVQISLVGHFRFYSVDIFVFILSSRTLGATTSWYNSRGRGCFVMSGFDRSTGKGWCLCLIPLEYPVVTQTLCYVPLFESLSSEKGVRTLEVK